MSARRGDWVRVTAVILPAVERTGNLPVETRATDIRMWTKGFLLEETAQIGDEVTVETYIGRHQSGTLQAIEPYYDHDYGRCIPELLPIGRDLRALLAEYEASLATEADHEG